MPKYNSLGSVIHIQYKKIFISNRMVLFHDMTQIKLEVLFPLRWLSSTFHNMGRLICYCMFCFTIQSKHITVIKVWFIKKKPTLLQKYMQKYSHLALKSICSKLIQILIFTVHVLKAQPITMLPQYSIFTHNRSQDKLNFSCNRKFSRSFTHF